MENQKICETTTTSCASTLKKKFLPHAKNYEIIIIMSLTVYEHATQSPEMLNEFWLKSLLKKS